MRQQVPRVSRNALLEVAQVRPFQTRYREVPEQPSSFRQQADLDHRPLFASRRRGFGVFRCRPKPRIENICMFVMQATRFWFRSCRSSQNSILICIHNSPPPRLVRGSVYGSSGFPEQVPNTPEHLQNSVFIDVPFIRSIWNSPDEPCRFAGVAEVDDDSDANTG